jgi:hypothetical protein
MNFYLIMFIEVMCSLDINWESALTIDLTNNIYVPANGRSLQQEPDKDTAEEVNEQAQEESMKIDNATDTTDTAEDVQPDPKANLSEKRKALFEPLEPINGKRSAEMLLPPPDFEPTSYPKGWLVGKKRKLVNVDVVESMRRIAVQEMNRKVYNLSSGLTVHTSMISRSIQMLFFLANTSMSMSG